MKTSRTYQFIRLCIVAAMYRIPAFRAYAYTRLPRHHAGYEEYWVNTHGSNYRSATLKEDQEASAMQHYPTPEELLKRIAAYAPVTVLDVGCGYGKNVEVLAPQYDVQGADISDELLRNVRPDLRDKVFHLDIVSPEPGWVESHRKNWDVVFCWGVMMYFIDNQSQTLAAMKHMEAIAKKKVIIWEWRHVCDYMRSVYASDMFEYYNIPVMAGYLLAAQPKR